MEHRYEHRALRRLPATNTDTRTWYRITNLDTKARIDVYDEIGGYGVTAQQFIGTLNDLDAAEIEVHLNTPGGDVFDAIAMHNALREHPANVTTVVDGQAASAGSFLFQAGDTRIMHDNTQLMIHDAMTGGFGNQQDLLELAEILDNVSNIIAGIYASRSGEDTETWRTRMRAETRYGAQEALEAGLADEIINPWPKKYKPGEPGYKKPKRADDESDSPATDEELARILATTLMEAFQ
jgi:ATP-dependent Clp endopeptidase proteolytic subunit ClpP